MVKQVGAGFQCEDCKLQYREREWAEKCEEWCLGHHSCNLAITRHAIRL